MIERGKKEIIRDIMRMHAKGKNTHDFYSLCAGVCGRQVKGMSEEGNVATGVWENEITCIL